MSKLLSIVFAVVLSFLMFLGMTWMIKPEVKIVESAPPPPISIDYKEVDDPVKDKIRTFPEFEEPELPQVVSDISDTPKTPPTRRTFQHVAFNPGSPVIPGSVVGLWGEQGDNSAVPKVRINPRYPRVAAEKGLEGYVTMTFDINAMGATENITIVDQKPRGVFAKEARRALAKWKYTPKLKDNIAIAQPGQTVTLEFKLEQEML